ADRFHGVRVEGLAGRIDGLESRGLEALQQLPLDELDPLEDRCCRSSVLEITDALEVVDRLQEPSDQVALGTRMLFRALALGALPVVVELRSQSQVAVHQGGQLCL